MTHIKLHFFLFIFLSLISIGFSQSKTEYAVFLNEENQVIDATTFYKMKNSFLYGSRKIQKDSVTIFSIIQFYKFGKLDSIENSQTRQLLDRATNRTFSKDKIIIISFKDSIMGYSEYVKRLDSIGESKNFKPNISSEKVFYSYRKKFDIGQKKCRKRFEKYDFEIVYFYRHNRGYDYQTKNFEFLQISSPLRALFFNRSHGGYVILKPDGNYFYYNRLKEDMVKDLLENDWKPYIKDYTNAKEQLLYSKIGFFEALDDFQSITKTFFIDSTGAYKNKSLPANVDPNAILVSKRNEIPKYLTVLNECYSYASY